MEDGKGAEGVKNMEVSFSFCEILSYMATQEKKLFNRELLYQHGLL